MTVPLVGGYRNIPAASMGTTVVFCDTRTITWGMARSADKPEFPMKGGGEGRDFIRETDLTVFLGCTMSSMGLKVNMKLFRSLSLMRLLRFFRDGIQLGALLRRRG